jgi:hypothetical protein
VFRRLVRDANDAMRTISRDPDTVLWQPQESARNILRQTEGAYPMPIPMPSPSGHNRGGLTLPDNFFGGMAMDEMPKFPRAAVPGAAGGNARDQDDDDNGTVFETPAQVAYARLFKFLADKLNQDEIDQVQSLVGHLLADTDNGKGAPAMDSRRPSYSQRFPNANRLRGRN